jgi:phosphatidate cytidylyltransferase
MKRVLTAAVLIPLVLLIVMKAPAWIFLLITGVFALIATWEYLNILAVPRSSKFLTLATIAVFFLAYSVFMNTWSSYPLLSAASVGLYACALLPIILLLIGLSSSNLADGFHTAATCFFSVPYIVLPLWSLIWIRTVDSGLGWFFLLLLFAIVWSGDIFAYYVGRSFGRHKLAPRISPGKSWEGAVASIVGASIVAVILVYFAGTIQTWAMEQFTLEGAYGVASRMAPAPLWLTTALAVVVNCAAQLGDLAESMLKRGAGVKDSGTLFPGHGGVLDRIDALLFAGPVAAIIFPIVQYSFIHFPPPTR